MRWIFLCLMPLLLIGCGEAEIVKNQSPQALDLPPITPLLARADPLRGQALARQHCSSCHSFQANGHRSTGPGLWAIMGQEIGTRPGYFYSRRLRATAGTWDNESLNQYLYAPHHYLPGTNMQFTGLSHAQDRADLILWLHGLQAEAESVPP